MGLRQRGTSLVRIPTPEESERNAISLVDNLKKKGFIVPEKVFDNLSVIGLHNEGDQAAVIAMALVAGVDLTKLINMKNIQAVARAWEWTRDLGAMPGTHYYLVPYGGEYSPVQSVKWLRSNVEQHSLVAGRSYTFEQKPVFGARLEEQLEYHVPGYIPDKGNRGHFSRFVSWIGNVNQMTDPDANWSFGYFLAKGINSTDGNGNPKVVGNDSINLRAGAAGNTGANRAFTRSERDACRKVTRMDYALDKLTVDERIASVLSVAQARLYSNQLQLPEEAASYSSGELGLDNGDDGYDELDDNPVIEVRAEKVKPEPEEQHEETQFDIPTGDERESMTWNQISLEVYKGVTAENRGTMDQLYQLKVGKTASAAAIKLLREWFAAAAQKNEVLGVAENGKDVTFADFVFYCAFGVEFGVDIYEAQARMFFNLIAKEASKNKWVYVDDSEGAQMIRSMRDALAKVSEGAVAEIF